MSDKPQPYTPPKPAKPQPFTPLQPETPTVAKPSLSPLAK
jgi:hypothetical protein